MLRRNKGLDDMLMSLRNIHYHTLSIIRKGDFLFYKAYIENGLGDLFEI